MKLSSNLDIGSRIFCIKVMVTRRLRDVFYKDWKERRFRPDPKDPTKKIPFKSASDYLVFLIKKEHLKNNFAWNLDCSINNPDHPDFPDIEDVEV